jgi:hypothetical protein
MKAYSILALMVLTPLLTPAYAITPVNKVIWDAWYTVTLNQNIPYGYYHDQVEIKENKIHFQNQYWKSEGGTIQKEQLGAFAMNNQWLTPLFFNYHLTARSLETNIDGTVMDGKNLTVKIQKGNTQLNPIKKQIPQKIIFSIFFPLWVGKQLNTMKTGKTISFSTLLEDKIEARYQTISGTVRLEKPNAFSIKTKTSAITVTYRNQKSLWFVEKTGMPIQILIPVQPAQPQSITVEKVLPERAQTFLPLSQQDP